MGARRALAVLVGMDGEDVHESDSVILPAARKHEADSAPAAFSDAAQVSVEVATAELFCSEFLHGYRLVVGSGGEAHGV